MLMKPSSLLISSQIQNSISLCSTTDVSWFDPFYSIPRALDCVAVHALCVEQTGRVQSDVIESSICAIDCSNSGHICTTTTFAICTHILAITSTVIDSSSSLVSTFKISFIVFLAALLKFHHWIRSAES